MYTGDITHLIISIIIAAFIGVIGGAIVGGRGKGILGNAIFGVLGSLFAGWLFPVIGLSVGGKYGTYIESIIGTCLVIIILNAVLSIFFKRR